jgi:hypothetical protein
VGVDDVVDLGGPAADLDLLAADLIGVGWKTVGFERRHLRAGQPVGRAGGEADADVVLRDDGRALLVEQRVTAGVIAVIVGIDHVFDGQRRDFRDRRLDLVVERRELRVHHDDAVRADGDGDVPAEAFQHVGVVAEVGGLNLDLGEIRLLRLDRAGAEHCGARQCGDADPFHRCPPVTRG